MNARSARRLLVAAFALSLTIHLIFALNFRPRREAEPSGVEVVSLEHRAVVVHVSKTPPPAPRRSPRPRASSAPKATSKPRGEQAAGNGGATGKATPAPTPSATAVPSGGALDCRTADVPAALLATPPPPDIPVDARAEGTSGTAVVRVALDALAAVTGTTVAQSSGNPALDVVATGMARAAHYAPAQHLCKPVPGSYDFTVKFVAW